MKNQVDKIGILAHCRTTTNEVLTEEEEQLSIKQKLELKMGIASTMVMRILDTSRVLAFLRHNRSRSNDLTEADYRELHSDWEQVGFDLRAAMKKYKKEYWDGKKG